MALACWLACLPGVWEVRHWHCSLALSLSLSPSLPLQIQPGRSALPAPGTLPVQLCKAGDGTATSSARQQLSMSSEDKASASGRRPAHTSPTPSRWRWGAGSMRGDGTFCIYSGNRLRLARDGFRLPGTLLRVQGPGWSVWQVVLQRLFLEKCPVSGLLCLRVHVTRGHSVGKAPCPKNQHHQHCLSTSVSMTKAAAASGKLCRRTVLNTTGQNQKTNLFGSITLEHLNHKH